MRIESILRHLAIAAVATLFVFPVSADPGRKPSNLGKADDSASFAPEDPDRPGNQNGGEDKGHKTGQDSTPRGGSGDSKKDDRKSRKSGRRPAQEEALTELGSVCLQRTRLRARHSARCLEIQRLTRTLLRRRR